MSLKGLYLTVALALVVTAGVRGQSPYGTVRVPTPPSASILPPVLDRPVEPIRPPVLDRPLEPETPPEETALVPVSADQILLTPIDAPSGFSGRSSVLPSEGPGSNDFRPVEDRWRIGYPTWDRYGNGHPWLSDYPYTLGRLADPYHQNVLKGDYPIIGQNTFLNLTAATLLNVEGRGIPTPTTPFESTRNPFQEEFFGQPSQFIYTQYFRMSLDLFHGDAAFKPADWRIKVTPVFNVNYLNVDEWGIVNPNVGQGTTRLRDWGTLEEWFAEVKLADLSPDYDFVSTRVGSQFFNSDFRGFLFVDTNRAARLFGTHDANRGQFNFIAFDQLDKNTNSLLNRFRSRDQYVFIANYYRQDFGFPGFTSQWSVHYNMDEPSIAYDDNGFLVRPAPVGTFQPHRVDAVYLGWTGDGHIDRFNINSAFYWALGRDSHNPFANQAVDINAQMAALEVSYDRDWARFRVSGFYASGDGDISNSHGTGFDAINGVQNFAGGQFSYFMRQNLPLFGVNLSNRFSLLPDLRPSNTFQSQSNFVNPGLFLVNAGFDTDVTPKLRLINNVNFLWFDKTNVLEQFLFDSKIDREIGTDISTGFEYRPLLSNNVIITGGFAALIPAAGLKDIYNRFNGDVGTLVAGFMELILTY